MKIKVENIKCGGCASSIIKTVNDFFDTTTTAVDIENGVISVNIADDKKLALASVLMKIGYLETGSVEGLKAVATKAKSFVSCAVGK